MSYSPKIESLLRLFENQTPFLGDAILSWSLKTSLKFFSEFRKLKIHSVRMTRVDARINKRTPEVYCEGFHIKASLASLLLVTFNNYRNIYLVLFKDDKMYDIVLNPLLLLSAHSAVNHRQKISLADYFLAFL